MTTTAPQLSILIAGAGIAGPVLAYWLHRGGIAHVTVVERDPAMRTTGQSVDLRGPGVPIVKAMGLLDEVKKRHTGETGMRWVDGQGRKWAEFGLSGSEDQRNQSLTSEFEIFRGELAEIFYQATKSYTEYIFDDSIASITNNPSNVHVTFTKGTPARTYDLAIGADGIGSPLRAMAFDTSRRDFLHPRGGYFSFFTLPTDHLKGSSAAEWYNAPGRRMMLLRPDPQGRTRGNLMHYYGNDEGKFAAFKAAQKQGPAALKKLVREHFSGAGFIVPEILDGMDAATDFYVQEIAQVRLPVLYKDRVTFVGDAASCPSPSAGLGTSLAIQQSYMLAGELCRTPQDIPAALRRYDEAMKPIIAQSQHQPAVVARVLAPETAGGISAVLWTLWFITATGLDRVLMWIATRPVFRNAKTAAVLDLPEYQWGAEKKS